MCAHTIKKMEKSEKSMPSVMNFNQSNKIDEDDDDDEEDSHEHDHHHSHDEDDNEHGSDNKSITSEELKPPPNTKKAKFQLGKIKEN